jgi:hypothetical protein
VTIGTLTGAQTRIYYQNGDNVLNEICWTAGRQPAEWYHGKLNDSGYKMLPQSILTAAVDDQWLKVYYQLPDQPNEVWVAWVVLGEVAWARRKAATFPG